MRARLVLAAACAVFLQAGASITAGTFDRPGLVVKVAPVTVAPGGRAETTITLEIRKGFRIVAPGTVFRSAQPAILAFDAADGVFALPPAWPAGTSWRAVEEDPEVKVYEGRLDLKVTLAAAPKASPQELALQGRLRYQMIKGNFFDKVAVLPLSIPVKVEPPAAPPAKGATRR